MREYAAFRIPDKNARRHLQPDQGKDLGGVRAVVVRTDGLAHAWRSDVRIH
jgi:hypothetical protein